jgi:hypothetical protein
VLCETRIVTTVCSVVKTKYESSEDSKKCKGKHESAQDHAGQYKCLRHHNLGGDAESRALINSGEAAQQVILGDVVGVR